MALARVRPCHPTGGSLRSGPSDLSEGPGRREPLGRVTPTSCSGLSGPWPRKRWLAVGSAMWICGWIPVATTVSFPADLAIGTRERVDLEGSWNGGCGEVAA